MRPRKKLTRPTLRRGLGPDQLHFGSLLAQLYGDFLGVCIGRCTFGVAEPRTSRACSLVELSAKPRRPWGYGDSLRRRISYKTAPQPFPLTNITRRQPAFRNPGCVRCATRRHGGLPFAAPSFELDKLVARASRAEGFKLHVSFCCTTWTVGAGPVTPPGLRHRQSHLRQRTSWLS